MHRRPPSTSRATALVGRARERDALRLAQRRAAGGAGSVVLVAGEPGVGKTRLVEEAASGHDGLVLWATCSEGAGAPPFWPWVQLLRACPASALDAAGPAGVHVAALRDGPPATGTLDDDPSRFRLFEAVAGTLAAAAADVPLLVVVDDLHWADEGSIRLLQFVGAEVPRLPVLLLGTYRDTEMSAGSALDEAVQHLGRSGTHLALRGLGPDDLVTLVRSVAGEDVDVDAGLGERLHRRTGGNPFFARELTRLLRVDGRLQRAQPDGLHELPGGVRAVVARRLARLPQPTSDLLSWAALVGTSVEVAVLAAATGRAPRDVLTGLEPAALARVVVPVDVATFRFAHDLVRETLVQATAIGDRAARHAALGAALAASAGDDGERIARVAGHLVAAVPVGDVDEALRWAVRAAEQATAVQAYESAADWYDRAIATRRVAAAGDRDEGALLLALGGARLAAGHVPAARAAFAAAAGLARDRGDAEQLASAALGLGAGLGGIEVSLFDQLQIDLLDEALAALPDGDSSLRARVLARLSVALAFVESSERRARVSDDAVAMARRVGDDVALGHALAGWCDAFSGPDDVDRRLAAATEVVELGVASRQRGLELLGRRLRVVALLERGRLGETAAEVETFARIAGAHRQPLYRWYVPLWRSTLATAAGDFAEAARLTDEAERVGGLASSENARVLVAVQRFVRLRHEGRFDDAAGQVRSLLGTALEAAAPSALEGSLLVGDVVVGAVERARRRADRLAAEGLPSSRADSEWLPDLAQLADAAVALDHRGLAAAVADALEPYAELFVVEGIGAAVCGAVAHYAAGCAAVLRRDREATRLSSRAEELHRSAGLVVPPPPLTATRSATVRGRPPGRPVLRLEGRVWTIAYGDVTVRLPDSKGLRDLAVLLRAPGRAVHVSELTGVPATSEAPDLDATAVAAYRRRLAGIEEDLLAAEADHDVGRSAALRLEQEFLVAELTGALGLGGRPRRSGDPVDRARKAVSARIRASVSRIGDVHPLLGRHLTNAVKTGTWCSYEPEQPVDWTS